MPLKFSNFAEINLSYFYFNKGLLFLLYHSSLHDHFIWLEFCLLQLIECLLQELKECPLFFDILPSQSKSFGTCCDQHAVESPANASPPMNRRGSDASQCLTTNGVRARGDDTLAPIGSNSGQVSAKFVPVVDGYSTVL